MLVMTVMNWVIVTLCLADFLCSSGSSRQIALADDSAQLSMSVDNRESTDPVFKKMLATFHRLRLNRNHIHDHDFPGFHDRCSSSSN